jgi:MFS superfamily sulfate permease-like transporter
VEFIYLFRFVSFFIFFSVLSLWVRGCLLLVTDSSFVPPLVYAVLGSSRDIAIGPVAVVSLLLGTLLKREVNPTKQPTLYLHLAFTATFFAGVFQAGLGLLR